MSFFGAVGNTATTASADKDIEVADPPSDSISSIAFAPHADYLAVGSWDNNVISFPFPFSFRLYETGGSFFLQVRIYEVGAGGQTQGKAMYPHQGPVLSVCWNKVCTSALFLFCLCQLPSRRTARRYYRVAQTTPRACSTPRRASRNK